MRYFGTVTFGHLSCSSAVLLLKHCAFFSWKHAPILDVFDRVGTVATQIRASGFTIVACFGCLFMEECGKAVCLSTARFVLRNHQKKPSYNTPKKRWHTEFANAVPCRHKRRIGWGYLKKNKQTMGPRHWFHGFRKNVGAISISGKVTNSTQVIPGPMIRPMQRSRKWSAPWLQSKVTRCKRCRF